MDSTVTEAAPQRQRRGRKPGGHNSNNRLRIEDVTRAINAARLAGFTLVVDETGLVSLVPVVRPDTAKGTNANEQETEKA
jgi:hypothetical protein